MTLPSTPFLVRLYNAGANLIASLAYRRVRKKLMAQGVDATRCRERMGYASKSRADGPLLWFHAASVGETLSVLRLITHLGEVHPSYSFLITSGTATSAQIVAKRLPPRCQHQFAPLDCRKALRRFLDHWKPSAAVFVESELWPQMLQQTQTRGIPLALVNARISERSFGRWKKFITIAQFVLGHFTLIHTQDDRTTAHLHEMGFTHAFTGQNLKSVSGPLPYDVAEFANINAQLDQRPVWIASSTHPGEDEIMLDAHQSVLQTHGNALLILVPRHPERATTIEMLITDRSLSLARRSNGGEITTNAHVYLADTLGETGLWYALCPITCLCGSFSPVGGHNPYEPAYAGSAVVHGPLYANFAQTYADFDAHGGALQVTDAAELSQTIVNLMSAQQDLQKLQTRSLAFATAQDNMLDVLSESLSKALALR
ncbi:3-deoxy-D-manno-octulosonic acid transferase [Roseovarius sp. EL26]|uniref:3-deoxy-D-manno-octulosonic acid transferase n=1 Tax=Roseovarius sp. EL26 TaxID=2126672 RepID=UPI000EA0116B|nr:3-deoxy-D-manno-octulosonic acid transferase [Roseovarius sp. EL26]